MDNPISINVNGYDTYYTNATDTIGDYLLIAIPENAGKDIASICGVFIAGHLIRQVDYCKIEGKRFIKAYF